MVSSRNLKTIPRDPITESRTTWVVVYSSMGNDDMSLEPGIVDLNSGAEGVGLDGTPYAEW